jgi:hypothetical protein
MKRGLIFVFLLLSVAAPAQQPDIPSPNRKEGYIDKAPANCKIKGMPMNAKVKIVDKNTSPVFKVRIVNHDEDLTVRFPKSRSSVSNRCGQWYIVTGEAPDFTVAFVEYGEDFTVCIVECDY